MYSHNTSGPRFQVLIAAQIPCHGKFLDAPSNAGYSKQAAAAPNRAVYQDDASAALEPVLASAPASTPYKRLGHPAIAPEPVAGTATARMARRLPGAISSENALAFVIKRLPSKMKSWPTPGGS